MGGLSIPGFGGGAAGGVKSPVTTTNTVTTSATGYGAIEGDSSNVIAGLTASDGGTVKIESGQSINVAREIALRALDLGGKTLDLGSKSFSDALASNHDAQAGLQQLATTLNQTDEQRSADEFRKLVMVLAVTVGVMFLAPYLFKRG